ncbi:nuclear transport factor 2 family protein [Paremcibacter congregatus]|uniref:Lumazine-binding protein n=1 Tax=Paremcibacter congregatus TaxID=2043170 RepID=A0A2G4YNI0_9PROT|nr:nuclear transport factor 2 family protein [Paremcibacter congregatus]PHZ83870.1 hypothetical protein CRD36_16100 [Paremcibacter congregatus]QDE27575.1 nuclear transport factor 2 family protein [Paremcibacter congregatus]
MKVFRIIIIIVFGLSLVSCGQKNTELDDISVVVQKYLDGTSQGKPQLVEEAFLPSLEIQWLGSSGELLRRKGPDYISRIEEGKVVPRYGRIIKIDSTDRSAMVKVEIEWNDRLYTDYMLILKVEGKWRIANKIATWVELE